jgi:superfamily II DNA or RNA helicase
MNSLLFEKYDNYYASVKITASTDKLRNEILTYLYRKLTYVNEKIKYTWQYDRGLHDGNEHIFDKKKQIIPIGLIPKTVKYLKEGFPDLKIGVSDEVRTIYSNPNGDITEEKIKEYCNKLNLYNKKKKVPVIPYEHQIKICERAINGRRISIMAATSSGKSLSIYVIARYMIEVERRKVLIITPSSGLVVQLYSDFLTEYGWDEADKNCTLVYTHSKDKLTKKEKNHLEELNLGEEVMFKDITISTWQSLQNKLPILCPSCKKIRIRKKRPLNCPECNKIKEKSKRFFASFTAVIVDEAHSVRGEVLREVLEKCDVAINFKIGVSGTLPDEGLDSALIEGSLGRKETVIKLCQLIKQGILPPLEINAIKIPYEEKFRKFICRQNFDSEYYLLTNNGSRKKVMEILINANKITTDQNTLILYKRKDTLDDMYKFLSEKFPQFKYHIIIGDVAADDREVIRNELRVNVGNIIIATYGTMRQGVNIELLHNLIFAEFSKSMYSIVQAMGRVARAHPNKTISRVFDIFDDCSYLTTPKTNFYPTLKENYSLQHYHTRNSYYKTEEVPVTEFSLEGIYEAAIDPDGLKERKELAEKNAVEKANKKRNKQVEDISPQFD